MEAKDEKAGITSKLRKIAIPMGVGIVLGLILGTAIGKISIGLVSGIIIGGIGAAINRKRLLL
jgi:uncharacterized membrane protein